MSENIQKNDPGNTPKNKEPDKKAVSGKTAAPEKSVADKKDRVQLKQKLQDLKNKYFSKMNKKHVIIGVVIFIVLLFLVKGVMDIKNVIFKKKKPKAEATEVIEGIPVKVYKVKRMDFKDTLPLLGTIKGYKEIELKFQVSGVLESFNFEEGESIQEGDIIANLEQKEALLKLKYAEIEYNNTKKLFDAGGIIEAALDKSKLEYESAKSELEKTNIYAVSDGVLGTQDLDVGSYATPNDKIGTFVDISRVYAEFEVIEKDSPKLKLGLKCEIYVDAIPNKTFNGTIDVISPVITGKTRTQRIKVEIRNENNAIKPGMFVRGLVTTYEKKNTIIIPASSIKKGEEGYAVFVVNKEEQAAPPKEEPKEKDKKGKPAKKEKEVKKAMPSKEEVEKGAEETEGVEKEREQGVLEARAIKESYVTQDRIEVDKGLEEGELIVMEVYQDLQDKQKVEVAEVQEILY